MGFSSVSEIKDGNLIRITDLKGNTLTYPDFPVESHVVDANPPRPEWAK